MVQDQKGMRGGLFVNREAALRYVRSEDGFKPQAVVMVSGGFELDMNRNAGAVLRAESTSVSANRRRSPATLAQPIQRLGPSVASEQSALRTLGRGLASGSS